MSEFRIKKDPSVNKTVRMKMSLINEISALANDSDISFNALVVQMCKYAIEHLPKKQAHDDSDHKSNS